MLPAQIVSVLGEYSRQIDFQAIISADSQSGFSGADVWKIVTPDGLFALRRWPLAGRLPSVRLRGLHRLLGHVSHQGVDFVAVPLATDSGDSLLKTAEQSGFWQLEPWLPGVADYRSHPSKTRLQAAMTALARWHQAAVTFVPDEQVRRWFGGDLAAPSPAVQERWQKLVEITPRDLSRRNRIIEQSPESEQRLLCLEISQRILGLYSPISKELQLLRNERFALQPCLRDVWHDHVLFTGENVTGLIDASACRMENIATDLARLIGSFVEDDVAGWQTALDAYQQQRPLRLNELTLIRALDRSGVVLGALTWLEWLSPMDRRFSDMGKVLERLRYFQRRLAALA